MPIYAGEPNKRKKRRKIMHGFICACVNFHDLHVDIAWYRMDEFSEWDLRCDRIKMDLSGL